MQTTICRGGVVFRFRVCLSTAGFLDNQLADDCVKRQRVTYFQKGTGEAIIVSCGPGPTPHRPNPVFLPPLYIFLIPTPLHPTLTLISLCVSLRRLLLRYPPLPFGVQRQGVRFQRVRRSHWVRPKFF